MPRNWRKPFNTLRIYAKYDTYAKDKFFENIKSDIYLCLISVRSKGQQSKISGFCHVLSCLVI